MKNAANLDFSGKTVLVTGSTQGVGRAVAEHLAKLGANLILHGLNEDASAREAVLRCQEAGNPVHLVTHDLLQNPPSGIQEFVDRTYQDHGPIDMLVCNAGTYIDQPFLEMEFSRFDRTMRLNVYAYFLMVQRMARRWVADGHEGRVVLVGSINGRLAEDVHVAYDTSKGAVEMMVKSMAVSLAPHKIRVNGMAPGLVYTPLTAPALDDPTFKQWMEKHTPNGQVPGPDACGGAVAFLRSASAWHIHGQMLLVDGGMSAWQQPDP